MLDKDKAGKERIGRWQGKPRTSCLASICIARSASTSCRSQMAPKRLKPGSFLFVPIMYVTSCLDEDSIYRTGPAVARIVSTLASSGGTHTEGQASLMPVPPTTCTPGIFSTLRFFSPFRIRYSIRLKSDRGTDVACFRNSDAAYAVLDGPARSWPNERCDPGLSFFMASRRIRR